MRVLSFFASVEASALFISALTIGELRRGVEIKRRGDPDFAMRLGAWVDGIERSFADRILPVDARVARRWGIISADRSRPIIDSLLAATALANELTLVTRNSRDVRGINVVLLDPWQRDT